jgi:tRNA modification GTPase
VSDVPGTTRDYLQETFVVDGYAVHLSDTAGMRATDDYIELQGIALTKSVLEQSDAILLVNDVSLGVEHSDRLKIELLKAFPSTPLITLHNKSDLIKGDSISLRPKEILCSSLSGAGLADVRLCLHDLVVDQTSLSTDVLINSRQAALLRQISAALMSALQALEGNLSSDLLSVDLRASIRLLGDISGDSWNPDVLDTIFSRFCIGK